MNNQISIASPISTWVKNNQAHAFLILTFAIAWTIWLPVGFIYPEYLLLAALPGAWAPTIAAVAITRITDGKEGVRRFLQRILHWRVGIQWYLVTMLSIAVIALTAQVINMWLFGGEPVSISLPAGIPENGWLFALPIIFLVNIFVGGPLAEDIGWRGFALPKLRVKMPALDASLVIGIFWVIWHLPFFWFPQAKSAVGGIPLTWFMLMTTAWSVLFAWVYINTESILMPVLFHAAVNTTLGSLGILGQSSGDMSPVIINTLLTWFFVGLVIFFTGRDLKPRQKTS